MHKADEAHRRQSVERAREILDEATRNAYVSKSVEAGEPGSGSEILFMMRAVSYPRGGSPARGYRFSCTEELEQWLWQMDKFARESIHDFSEQIVGIESRLDRVTHEGNLEPDRQNLSALCSEARLRVHQHWAEIQRSYQRFVAQQASLDDLCDACCRLHRGLGNMIVACLVEEAHFTRLHVQATRTISQQNDLFKAPDVQIDTTRPVQAPNGRPYKNVQKALAKSDWQRDTDGRLVSKFEDCQISFCPAEVLPLGLSLNCRPTVIVSDLLDIIYCLWAAQGKQESICISDEQLASHRGVNLEVKTLKIQQEAMLVARSLRLVQRQTPGVDIAVLNWDSLPYGPPFSPTAQPLLYITEPGPILRQSLRIYGRSLPKIGAFYTPEIWRLSALHDRVAKCLARSLRCDWREHIEAYLPTTADEDRRYRAWRDHLTDAGVDPHAAYKGRPGDAIRSLENEIDKLARKGVLDLWTYNQKNLHLYHPEDQDKYGQLSPSNRLEAFLNLRIWLPPSRGISDVYLESKIVSKRAGWLGQKAAKKRPLPERPPSN